MAKIFQGIDDDFFADRICRRCSVFIFVTIATLMAADFILRDSMTCWNPAHFTASHLEYTNDVCMRKGELFYPFDPFEVNNQNQLEDRTTFDLARIQYLSIVLCLQAFLFRLPHSFWVNVAKLCGFPANDIVACTQDKLNQRRENWDCIAQQINTFLTKPNSLTGSTGSSIQGYVLFPIYILHKFGYIIILFVQFGIVSIYLGFNFVILQTDFQNKNIWLKDIEGNGNDTLQLDPFAKTVLCSFEIRHQARAHNYVVQCDVKSMKFIEFYMVIIWLFLWIAIAVTAFSFILWILYFASTIILPRHAYMKQRISNLIGNEELSSTDSQGTLSTFVSAFTKPDGRFVLALLEENTSTYVVSSVMKASWKLYMEEKSSGQQEEGARQKEQVRNLYPSFGAQGESVPLQDKSAL